MKRRGYKGRYSKKQGAKQSAQPKKSSSKAMITTKKKTSINDITFDIGQSATRAIEYEENVRFLKNYIQQTYSRGLDIVKALEDGEHPDWDQLRPPLAVSKETDADAKKAYDQAVARQEV